MRVLAILGIVVASLVLCAGVVLWALAPPVPLTPPERGASFGNVTVVEPELERAENRSVRVEGGRVASIDSAVAGAEWEGFLLPGLIDMHVHGADGSIAGQDDLFRLLYLAHGVTTVRNTGGGVTQLEERARIERGEIAGRACSRAAVWSTASRPSGGSGRRSRTRRAPTSSSPHTSQPYGEPRRPARRPGAGHAAAVLR